MKYLKKIIIVLAVVGIVIIIALLKNNSDWKEDFSPYSSRLLYTQANYVDQPSVNLVNETPSPIGSVETEEYIYFFNSLKNNPGAYRVYSFNKEKQVTKLEYEIYNEETAAMLVGVSTNDRKMILNYTDKVVLVDLFTQISREIYNGSRVCTSVYKQDLLYMNDDGIIHVQNLRTGKTHSIDVISASQFIVFEDSIYYLDNENNGCMSIYDINTGEITRTSESGDMGFFWIDGGVVLK
ncbi:MAG: hypothetical protein ACI4EN_03105 [Butyrivibrio sp.]